MKRNSKRKWDDEKSYIDPDDILNSDVFDENAEESVLGSIIAYPEKLSEVETMLSEDMFYVERNKTFFSYIKEAYSSGMLPDLSYMYGKITLNYTDENEKREMVSKLTELNKYSSNLPQDIELLNICRQKRIAADMARKIISGRSLEIEDVQEIISNAVDKMDERKQTSVSNLRTVMQNIVNRVYENQTRVSPTAKTLTGFSIIDSQGGFQEGMEIVLSAGSSQGKTAFAMTVVHNAIRQHQNVAIYSMEMSEFSVGMRLMNIDGLGLRSGDVKSEKLLSMEVNRVNNTANNLMSYGGDIFIDSSSKSNIDKILSSIRVLKRKHNIVGAVIDYVQILNVYSKYGSQEQVLADIARRLQEEAKNSKIWILVLSQFSRIPKGMSHEPTNDMIRGSGQILEACDISLLLYRPEVYKERYAEPYEDVDPVGTAKLEISKFRDGKLGTQIIRFEGEYMRFSEFQEHEIPRSLGLPANDNKNTINTPF